MEKQERSMVPAVETAIKILEYLSRFKHRASTLSDISKNISINKSTCHRILKVLENSNFVFYNEEKKQYSLGSHLVVLGTRASEFIDYLELSKPHLKWLCQETQQTVVLLEPISNNRLMYIAKEEPPLPVRVTVNIGQRFPLTSASFGKCFLAFMDEMKAEEIIKNIGLRQFTNKTITNLKEFTQELEHVRRKGYAESHEEYLPGVCGVAAPVFDLHGNVKQVISCLFLAQQPDTDNVSLYGSKVLEAATKLTKILGGRPPFEVLTKDGYDDDDED
ncbi:IclR family transcriptional regulator [Paradesulfitobacterium aromaticivorans]